MIAFDYSMSSPAMCLKTGDETYHIHVVNSRKKFEGTYTSGNFTFTVHYYDPKKNGHDDITRFGMISKIFLDNLIDEKDKVAAFEAYAFGAKGMLATIGECTGIMKHELVERGYSILTLSPTTVKKYATGSGKADKSQMAEAFHALHRFHVWELLGCKNDSESPTSDCVDSYFVYQTAAIERAITKVDRDLK
uniref:RuvC-like Holliday junction resolvase n=1 Tax=Ochrobactrum phage ORM_20 TaxID=2985243 RepID=A0A9N6ZGI9_9VIRU|nr:RuvC-like Holliday junction resolvase [Ochrobactrum phage ORM_20]